MSKLLLTIEDHYSHLNYCLSSQPDQIIIASYGLYAGITFDNRDTAEWGEQFRLYTRNFLNNLAGRDVYILIGVPTYKSCRGKSFRCKHCENEYIKQLTRLLNHKKKFKDFKWKISESSHAKCVIFKKGHKYNGVAGGRNLNDSCYLDASFTIDNRPSKSLYKHIKDIWAKSHILNEKSLNLMLEGMHKGLFSE